MSEYRAVRINKGRGGWGSGLTIAPDDQKNVVLSVTNGGIHPVAARIAELTGAEAVDGFANHVEDARVAAAVINCGGTARIGVYPKKRIPTVDVFPGEPSGPLAMFITDDIFVSAVTPKDITPLDEDAAAPAGAAAAAGTAGAAAGATASGTASAPDTAGTPVGDESGAADAPPTATDPNALPTKQERIQQTGAAMGGGGLGGFSGFVVKFGGFIGYLINTLLSSGRQAIQLSLQTIIPFMVYVNLLIGIVTYTGVSDWIANGVAPLASNPWGLILLGVITAIPVLSPILGPGAAIAQVVGVLMGTQIAAGALPVQYALPTLFAINGQVGCDFIPVGLSLGEAKPETVSVGVPAVLFSRLFTSPIAVVIAYFAGFLVA